MGYGDGGLICPPRVRVPPSRQQLEAQTEPRSQGSVCVQRRSHTRTAVATSCSMDGGMGLSTS